MHFQRIWVLRGPHVWSRAPVVEAELGLGQLQSFRPREDRGFTDRLTAWLPGMSNGETLAHCLQHVTLALLRLAGENVDFGMVKETTRPGFFRIIVAYEEEALARACLDAAHEI